eukprot:gene8839-biopygen2740
MKSHFPFSIQTEFADSSALSQNWSAQTKADFEGICRRSLGEYDGGGWLGEQVWLSKPPNLLTPGQPLRPKKRIDADVSVTECTD